MGDVDFGTVLSGLADAVGTVLSGLADAVGTVLSGLADGGWSGPATLEVGTEHYETIALGRRHVRSVLADVRTQ